MEKVLVTGATGFIGFEVAHQGQIFFPGSGRNRHAP